LLGEMLHMLRACETELTACDSGLADEQKPPARRSREIPRSIRRNFAAAVPEVGAQAAPGVSTPIEGSTPQNLVIVRRKIAFLARLVERERAAA
jgi:hypothetical protein